MAGRQSLLLSHCANKYLLADQLNHLGTRLEIQFPRLDAGGQASLPVRPKILWFPLSTPQKISPGHRHLLRGQNGGRVGPGSRRQGTEWLWSWDKEALLRVSCVGKLFTFPRFSFLIYKMRIMSITLPQVYCMDQKDKMSKTLGSGHRTWAVSFKSVIIMTPK